MAKRRHRLYATLAAFCCSALSGSVSAESSERALVTAREQINNIAKDIGSIERSIKEATQSKARTAEQRIADAVLLMGVKDYDRAADVLNEVVEKYPNHPTTLADGMRLLGETYFKNKQYLSARRLYQNLLDRGGERRFAAYREQAVVRLVDIALRTRDFGSLSRVFAQVASFPADGSAALAYAKGKGLYAQGKLDAAAASLVAVGADGQYAHQAAYLLGVIATKKIAMTAPAKEGATPNPKRFAQAIQQFRYVTKLARDSEEHRHVIDLAWLAVGRLLYESGDWRNAVESYNNIGRESPEFGVMLYELAWVYVRMGDALRAQRALEVLAVAAPSSDDVANAALLRGDLMLRAGKFDKSVKVYESVRGNYESMRDRVNAFLQASDDPGRFFDTLSQDQLELFEAGASLPRLVMRWAREGEDGDTAFAVIDDITICRRLIKESNEMINRLNAVLSSPNRVRAVPALKSGVERAFGMLNALAKARLRLANGLDVEEDDADLSSQLQSLRQARRRLVSRLKLVPVSSADFIKRESQANRQWNRASQGLQRLDLEIDTLQATINGLERMLEDGPQAGVVRSAAQLMSYRQALVEQKRLIYHYRQQVSQLRQMTEAGKIQVGFGDRRFVEDAQVREAFRQALWSEVKLAVRSGDDLGAYAKQLIAVLPAADRAQARIAAVLADIDKAVGVQTEEMRKVVARETANIVEYSVQLESLDQEARLVVGRVAMRNFQLVRDRLSEIVLRADVGITEEAWELREEQLNRVRHLKIERARGERRLQEEFEEVLDDNGGTEEQ